MPRPSSAAEQLAARSALIPLEVSVDPADVPTADDLEGLIRDASKPWTIATRGAAQWAMTLLAEAVRRVEPIKLEFAAKRAKLAQLEADAVAADAGRIDWFAAHLKRYALELREAGGEGLDGQRLRLDNGHVQTKANPARTVIDDEAALLAWITAEWKPDLVAKVTQTVVPVSLLELVTDRAVWPVTVLLSPCEHDVPVGEGLAEVDSGELLNPLLLEAGRGVICPECSAEALVAKVTSSRLAVVDADGREVPGARAVEATVTATVHPD